MATNFDDPQSRNEAILQNILGANNQLLPPFSRIEFLLIQLLQQTGLTNEEIAKKLAAPLDGSGEVEEGTAGQILQANGDGTTSWTDVNYGAPLVAETAADMTDHTRVYVYTGSETGYTSGHWYYWDGTAWVDGGVYNAVAVQTDTTLTESGVPADAKTTGDQIAAIKQDFLEFEENTFEITKGKNIYNPDDAVSGKYLELDGRITDYTPTLVTGFMPVEVGKYVTFSKNTSSGRAALSVNTYLFYDSAKEKITNSGGSWATSKIVPSGASFVRACFGKATEDVQIEITDDGVFTIPYEAYQEVYRLNEDIIIPSEQVVGLSSETVKGFNIAPIAENAIGSAYGTVGSAIGKHPEDTTLHWVKIPIKKNTKYYTNCAARFITVTDSNDIVLYNAGFYRDYVFETDQNNAKYLYFTLSSNDWNNGFAIISEGFSGAIQNVEKPSFIKGLNQRMFDSWFAVALTPGNIYFTVGIPEKLYYFNILSLDKNMINITLGGTESEDGYTVTPLTPTLENNRYGYTVYDDNLSVVASVPRGARNRISIYADNVSNCSALIIGDSIVARNNGKIGQTLLNAFSEREKTITLLGTLGTGDNKNEGRAGWTTSDYFTNKQYEGVTNPFYNPTTETFDFGYYMNNQNYSSVDYVIIHLGGNDLFSVGIDQAREKIAQTESNICAMIDSILSWNVNQKIIIQLAPTISTNVSYSSAVGGNVKLNRAKFTTYNAEMLVILQKYNPNVRISNDYMIVDPNADMADHIHPNDTGLEKIGMELLSQINCWQNQT